MKERIASNIYMSMTGDNPFDDMIVSASNINKISFKIAVDEIVDSSCDEIGLLNDYKDLSMVQKGESGMVKEDDFTDVPVESDYECESDLSMVSESDNGMVKDDGIKAYIDSQVMEIDEPGDVGSDSRSISDEYAKNIKKVNNTILKQAAFEDIVNLENLKMAFPFRSVQMALTDLYDKMSGDGEFEVGNIVHAKIQRAYMKWKKYVKSIKDEAKANAQYRDAFIKAKTADKLFNKLMDKNRPNWKELLAKTLTKIEMAHDALYLI